MSTDEGSKASRRRFLQAASVTAGTAAVAGQAAAAEGEGTSGNVEPDFGGWLGGVDGGYKDLRGKKEVTVTVGADGNGGSYAFKPAGIWIDKGTKVTFEWVSANHNIVPDSTPGSASWKGVEDTFNGGHTDNFTFDGGGIYTYFCQPHKSAGMKGGIAVGGDVPTVEIQEDTSILPDAAKALGVAGAGAMTGTLGLTYLFLKYGGVRSE